LRTDYGSDLDGEVDTDGPNIITSRDGEEVTPEAGS
jgi:hypothetical protein